jgi:hypothetical protein
LKRIGALKLQVKSKSKRRGVLETKKKALRGSG